MNFLKVAYSRVFQKAIFLAMPFLKVKEPLMQVEVGISKKVGPFLLRQGVKKVFIITDKNLLSLNLLEDLFAGLKEENIEYIVFDDVKPNPTDKNVKDALSLYQSSYKGNDEGVALIAFGGGSVIDTMKALKAMISTPKKGLDKLKGLLKVNNKKWPLCAAIPTTAGTGSEATAVAVISNAVTHEKYTILSAHLIPDYAFLDAKLTVGLPAYTSAITAMDALTHIIESFIGRSNTKASRRYAFLAIEKFNSNVHKMKDNPKDLHVREEMLLASYYAGCAFTRGFVGYDHACAHALGGYYNLPHGECTAVLLPITLEEYGSAVYRPLAELADHINLGNETDSQEVKAKKLIAYIRDMNKYLDIKNYLNVPYNFIVIAKLAKMADKEANPLYPVPKEMDSTELVSLISKAIYR